MKIEKKILVDPKQTVVSKALPGQHASAVIYQTNSGERGIGFSKIKLKKCGSQGLNNTQQKAS